MTIYIYIQLTNQLLPDDPVIETLVDLPDSVIYIICK